MKDQTREEPEILAAAERQMHAWALSEEQGVRAARHGTESPMTGRGLRFVTISREVGAGGGEVAAEVGQRLGWNVFDKNLLDRIADRFHLPRTMLNLVDETQGNWVYDILGSWMDRKLVPHEKYVACLTRIVLAASHQGCAVFVGRGAQFCLPRHELLAVRIIASTKFRVRQMMERRGIGQFDAQRLVAEIDAGRRQFVQQFFHRDITDPHNHDLVINVEHCGKLSAVNAILAAL